MTCTSPWAYNDSIGSYFQKAAIIMLDSFGCLEANCNMNDSLNLTKIDKQNYFFMFPNPSHSSFRIDFSNNQSDINQLTIYDPIGKIIYREFIENSSQIINCEGFKQGIYFVELYNFINNSYEIQTVSIIH